jgi:Fe-Mn family superoxide dismutase
MPHAPKPLLKNQENKLKGISQKTIEIHRDKLYAGYVAKRNEVEEKMVATDKPSANQTYSAWRGLKEGETFAANGMILHEYYFGVLGGDGQPQGEVLAEIEKIWGSYETWTEDFTACGMSARGWAVLAYDPSDNKLHNYIGDTQNQGAVWGVTPVIAMDVFEHSYFIDYGSDRKSYIQAFLQNLDWGKINKIYAKVTKIYPAAEGV